MLRFILLASTVLALGAISGARGAPGQFAVKGAGTTPCSQYVTALDENAEAFSVYAGWLAGYITGLNQQRSDTFDLAGWRSVPSILFAIRNYCQHESVKDIPFHRAAGQVVALIEEDGLAHHSPRLELRRPDGETVSVYAATLKRVKSRLSELGYYDGPADQSYTQAVAEALRSYQQDQDLPDSGVPTQQTLLSLFEMK